MCYVLCQGGLFLFLSVPINEGIWNMKYDTTIRNRINPWMWTKLKLKQRDRAIRCRTRPAVLHKHWYRTVLYCVPLYRNYTVLYYTTLYCRPNSAQSSNRFVGTSTSTSTSTSAYCTVLYNTNWFASQE